MSGRAAPGFCAPSAGLPVGWMADAACRGKDARIFFPAGTDHGPAFAVCARCPVRADCLDYALATHSAGIWGGTSDRQRERIRTNLRKAVAWSR
jgi:WhiB family redox-sensing transcriptional regulator